MKSSIKSKLVSFFGVILVVGLAISAFVSNRLCQNIIETNAIECFDGTVRSEAEKLNLILNEKIKMIANASKIPLLGRQEVEIEQKLQILEEVKEIFNFKDIAYVDLEGNAYSVTGIRKKVSEDAGYQKAIAGEANVSTVVNQMDGEIVFTFFTPVAEQSGEIVGFIMGIDGVESFRNILDEKLAKREYIVLDSEGKIVIYSKNGLISKQMQTAKEPSAMGYEIYKDMLAGKQGTSLCKCFETGSISYVSYAPMELGWSIAIINDRSHVMSILKTFNLELLIVMVIITTIGVIAVYWVSSSLAKRISEIASYLGNVASGDFKHPVPDNLLELRDEMGDAARALSTMKVEIEEMLGTIRECADYMNDQMEDLTGDIKKALKNNLAKEGFEGLGKENQEDMQKRIENLNQIKEIVSEMDTFKSK